MCARKRSDQDIGNRVATEGVLCTAMRAVERLQEHSLLCCVVLLSYGRGGLDWHAPLSCHVFFTHDALNKFA